MMKPDLEGSDLPSDGTVLSKQVLIGIGGGLVLLFLCAVIAGYTSVVIGHGGPSMVDAAMLATMLLAALAVGFAMWRFWPCGGDEPVAPRVKSARMMLAALIVISFPLGIMLGMSDHSATGLFSNGPVSPAIAAVAIAVWLIAVPLLTWMWWKRVDEHEADAYREGAFIAVHAYMFIAPTWWMGTRAGWLPAQEPMVVLLLVCVVWSIVSIVRRYA